MLGAVPTNSFNKLIYETELNISRLFLGVAYDGYLQDLQTANDEEQIEEICDVLNDPLTYNTN